LRLILHVRLCVSVFLLSVETSSEPPDRIEAVRKVAEAAAFLPATRA